MIKLTPKPTPPTLVMHFFEDQIHPARIQFQVSVGQFCIAANFSSPLEGGQQHEEVAAVVNMIETRGCCRLNENRMGGVERGSFGSSRSQSPPRRGVLKMMMSSRHF